MTGVREHSSARTTPTPRTAITATAAPTATAHGKPLMLLLLCPKMCETGLAMLSRSGEGCCVPEKLRWSWQEKGRGKLIYLGGGGPSQAQRGAECPGGPQGGATTRWHGSCSSCVQNTIVKAT